MSKEFIQFTFPCADCLVRAACQDKPVNREDLLEKNHTRCLAMPNYETINKYPKVFMECWANIGWQAIERIKSDEVRGVLPPKYVDFMIDVAGLLQWIVNSKSWKDGELHDFDLHEVRRKLKAAKGWI
jgi:hypothetical protein